MGYAAAPFFAGGFALLAVFAAVILRGDARTAALLVCVSAALGLGWTWGHYELFISPPQQYVGEELTASVRITDYPAVYDDYSVTTVRLTGEGMPRCKIRLYDSTGFIDALRPGDEISARLRFSSALTLYGEETDTYVSDGVYLRAYLRGDAEHLGRWQHSWLYFPKTMAQAVKTAALAAFHADVAPLMKALLTGDKTELYDEETVYAAMQAGGIAHLVAVSGMHVSFLISALYLFGGRRWRTAFIGIPAVIIFMAMTGFTPSVVRAGVMQALFLLAPVLRREADGATSLAAAALPLLAVNPEAVMSVSFQLSFAALGGLVLFTPRIYEGYLHLCDSAEGWISKILSSRICFSAVKIASSSLGALAFTTPLVCLHFGYIPLYSVITNLICLPLMSLAFGLGYAVCVLSLFAPAAAVCAGWVVGWLPRWCIAVTKFIAALPFSVVYTGSNIFAWWVAFCYVCVFGSRLLPRGAATRAALPLGCCAAGFALAVILSSALADVGSLTVTAVDVGQGQSIVALTPDSAVVIDCGGINTTENAGDKCAAYLAQMGRGRVELLVLTHLHSDHVNGVTRLLSRVEVERMVLPPDTGDEDDGWRDTLLQSAAEYGTEVVCAEENFCTELDDTLFSIYAPVGGDDTNERGLFILGSCGEFDFLVTGDARETTEAELVSLYALPDIELLIAGHHGSKYATSDTLLDAVTPEVCFVSAGYNTYGHPSEETLARLESRGVEIHRTDEEGNISLTTEG